MQFEGGLAILSDRDAGKSACCFQSGAAQERRRAAEERSVPLVEAALRNRVEHLVFGRHALERAQVPLDRIGVEENVRRLNEEQFRITSEIADRFTQETAKRR